MRRERPRVFIGSFRGLRLWGWGPPGTPSGFWRWLRASMAFVLTMGDVNRFQRGKQVASYLGLIPREYSSGGKQPRPEAMARVYFLAKASRAALRRSRPARSVGVSPPMPMRKWRGISKKLPGTTLVSYFSQSNWKKASGSRP